MVFFPPKAEFTSQEIALAKGIEKSPLNPTEIEKLIIYKEKGPKAIGEKAIFSWLRPKRITSEEFESIKAKSNISDFDIANFNPKLMKMILDNKKKKQLDKRDKFEPLFNVNTRTKSDLAQALSSHQLNFVDTVAVAKEPYDHFKEGEKEARKGLKASDKLNKGFQVLDQNDIIEERYENPQKLQNAQDAVGHLEKAQQHYKAALSKAKTPEEVSVIKSKLKLVKEELLLAKSQKACILGLKINKERDDYFNKVKTLPKFYPNHLSELYKLKLSAKAQFEASKRFAKQALYTRAGGKKEYRKKFIKEGVPAEHMYYVTLTARTSAIAKNKLKEIDKEKSAYFRLTHQYGV